tara:strand:+ start:451 stop:705 length:255 start_codon:yes stop_codon:yes gene_type:complete
LRYDEPYASSKLLLEIWMALVVGNPSHLFPTPRPLKSWVKSSMNMSKPTTSVTSQEPMVLVGFRIKKAGEQTRPSFVWKKYLHK